MSNENPMKIVLVEDDVSACKAFMDCANSRTDIAFVGMTGRSNEGLEYVQSKLPEAVILDMELNWGEGSGLEFLEKFQKMDLSTRPIIVVTTRNRSEVVQESLHEYGVEWIFCKKQMGYSAEMVVNHLLKLRPYLHSVRGEQHAGLQTLETPEELEKRIIQRIIAELNAIGLSTKLKGRKLAIDAIFNLVKKNGHWDSETLLHDLAKMHTTNYNNVIRNIQTAIHDAWKNGDVETLEKYYTAPIRKDLGAPSPTEFIHFYADKIRRST